MQLQSFHNLFVTISVCLIIRLILGIKEYWIFKQVNCIANVEQAFDNVCQGTSYKKFYGHANNKIIAYVWLMVYYFDICGVHLQNIYSYINANLAKWSG